MAQRAPSFTIILAGGKGTRMQSSDLHKVCFPIDGKPVINRALDVYKSCGVPSHIVVVGAMAGQVIETIGSQHEGVIFAYQAQQLGTAHAARQGAMVLETLGEKADVLIVPGDIAVESQVLEQLFDLFYTANCDMAFVVKPRVRDAELGRVILSRDGSVIANVEVRDIWQRQILRKIRASAMRASAEGVDVLTNEEIIKLIRERFSDAKAALAFGALWKAVAAERRSPPAEQLLEWISEEMTSFRFLNDLGETVVMTPEQAESTEIFNSSIYLVKPGAFRYVLDHLSTDNAQKEEYLSDMITILAQTRSENKPAFRVRALKVENANYVMAFNNPSELLQIESYIQSKKNQEMVQELPPSPAFRLLEDWKKAFRRLLDKAAGGERTEKELWNEMVLIYGDEAELIRGRAKAYLETLEFASEHIDPHQRVLLVRSPGRVNMMGRHVDHQGGHCNLMTIGYETLMVVHPRDDDRIVLYNRDSQRFPSREFSVSELVADLPWDDWISLVNSDKVSNLVLNAGGDWVQYVKAGVLRLQKKFATQRLRGVDMIVNGNIPIAAGLSSSSALVVATAEAMVAVNRLDTFPSQLVNLCGEGEWFVGTRGGSADHAAIKFGQKGKVVKVTFFEFAVEDIVPFPKEYVLVVCDSGVKAQKTTNAKDQFNHRVACYRIGFKLIRKLFPQYAPLLSHLRDVNTRTLGVPLSWIYKILLRLPEQATRDELERILPQSDLKPLFDTHNPPKDGLYPIRGVVLYGLAECERSRLFAEALRANQVAQIGRLMDVSHNGDRVALFAESGEKQVYRAPTSNSYLLDLIDDLESGDPQRVLKAQLQWQPGSYHCSIPEIDLMVDISRSVEGVEGAQLAGAGLGGCMMVLAHRDAVSSLARCLKERYYEPFGKSPAVLLCKPIAGSGVMLMDGSWPYL
jgi:galactokinase/NDP-sugar pyrophosphorylase family protein